MHRIIAIYKFIHRFFTEDLEEKDMEKVEGMLDNLDSDVRIQAINILKRRQNIERFGIKGTALVIRSLKDKHNLVRLSAVGALGKVGKFDRDNTIKALKLALSDENVVVSNTATNILIEFAGRDDTGILLDIAKNDNLMVQAAAYTSLANMGEDGLQILIEELCRMTSPTPMNIIHAISGIGEGAIPALEKVLSSISTGEEDKVVRRNVALTLQYIGEPSIPILEKMTGDQSEWVARTARIALNEIRGLAQCKENLGGSFLKKLFRKNRQ